jgi:hypothetical protein
VIPEIDIWRAATLMLKRYGEKALEESTKRVDDSRPARITTGRPSGAGSPQLSSNSPTTHRPDDFTDRNGLETTGQPLPLSTRVYSG